MRLLSEYFSLPLMYFEHHSDNKVVFTMDWSIADVNHAIGLNNMI